MQAANKSQNDKQENSVDTKGCSNPCCGIISTHVTPRNISDSTTYILGAYFGTVSGLIGEDHRKRR